MFSKRLTNNALCYTEGGLEGSGNNEESSNEDSSQQGDAHPQPELDRDVKSAICDKISQVLGRLGKGSEMTYERLILECNEDFPIDNAEFSLCLKSLVKEGKVMENFETLKTSHDQQVSFGVYSLPQGSDEDNSQGRGILKGLI